MHEAWLSCPEPYTPGLMVHNGHSDVEAGGEEVQGPPQVHREREAGLTTDAVRTTTSDKDQVTTETQMLSERRLNCNHLVAMSGLHVSAFPSVVCGLPA